MLDFIYYPVSFILWFWHQAFGFIIGETQAFSWALSIIFLTFTIRAILFKPFVSQVRSMRKMQDFAPEIKKIQKRYGNDKQRQAQEMQKLQREHGVNPIGGCLPILLQIPVFIGLNHVLRMFARSEEQGTGNYFFSAEGARQYIQADVFGSNLGEAIYNTEVAGGGDIANAGFHAAAVPVAVPMMILAACLTHLTARHSVQRQNPAAATQQTAIMNKMTLYVFPVGLLVFGAFLPLGLLLYFLANNGWTLMQQRLVYTWIDREDEAKKAAASEKRSELGPKPGQKPTKNKGSGTTSNEGSSGADGAEGDDEAPAGESQDDAGAPTKDGGTQSKSKQTGKQASGGSGSQARKQGRQAGSQAGKQGGSAGGKQTGKQSGQQSGQGRPKQASGGSGSQARKQGQQAGKQGQQAGKQGQQAGKQGQQAGKQGGKQQGKATSSGTGKQSTDAKQSNTGGARPGSGNGKPKSKPGTQGAANAKPQKSGGQKASGSGGSKNGSGNPRASGDGSGKKSGRKDG